MIDSASEMSSSDTLHNLKVCQVSIAETRALILDIEGAKMHPQKKRRVLFKARLRLAQLEAAVERGTA
jgi:hypothetical protein